jgi:UDP:flavonoid glycosyltransferase YjiC (YdhE family)
VLVCRPQLDEIPRLVSDRDDTFLVIDCMLFAALTAAERVRLPAAVLVHSAPGALLHPTRILAQEIPAPLNVLRAEVGLARLSHLWQAWQFAPALCGTIRALDPLAAEVPSTFDYAGPMFDRGPDADWHAPWSPDDPRPLVVVSFSTDQDQRSRIQRTVAGLTGKRYRVLVTTSASDVTGIERPENVVFVRYVPHADVLPGAAVTVSHGGHGTLTASLAHGVPLVCLPSPLIADQVPLAAQVQALGVGRMLDGERATPAEIAAAVDEVVATPSFHAAAHQLAAIIATQPGTHGAATRLEQLATR